MACYHPLKGFQIGITENGKKDLKITGYDAACVVQRDLGAPFEVFSFVPTGSYRNSFVRVIEDFIEIPCGRCIGCRLNYSRQWAVRCILESEYHDQNWFLTLTYDDDHVPYSEYVDLDGVIQTSMTLVKKDVQDFVKRVRSDLNYRGLDGFRYYCAGEYGDHTARPHYHMIAFGLHLDDLKLYKETPIGNYYTSDFLSSKWRNGYVIIGNVEYDSCAYVARYILKKQKGDSSAIYDFYNVCPEFSLSSRRPAIGSQYFYDHYISIFPRDSIVLPSGRCVRPPRLFDDYMSKMDEELMADIKLKRADMAKELQALKSDSTDMDIKSQRLSSERNQISRLSRLVRPVD